MMVYFRHINIDMSRKETSLENMNSQKAQTPESTPENYVSIPQVPRNNRRRGRWTVKEAVDYAKIYDEVFNKRIND